MKNIILVGMAGAGKSTIGVLLAKTLGMAFVDTDLIIQENEKMLLQSIIDNKGLQYFTMVEEKAIHGLTVHNTIIATGGSVIYVDNAMGKLKSTGTVVYLKVPFIEIERRLENIKTRGIAMKKGQTLHDLYNERAPLYEKYADIVIDLEGLNIEDAVGEIVKSVE